MFIHHASMAAKMRETYKLLTHVLMALILRAFSQAGNERGYINLYQWQSFGLSAGVISRGAWGRAQIGKFK